MLRRTRRETMGTKEVWKVEVGDIDHDFTLGGISNWGSIGFGGHEPCEGAMHK